MMELTYHVFTNTAGDQLHLLVDDHYQPPDPIWSFSHSYQSQNLNPNIERCRSRHLSAAYLKLLKELTSNPGSPE